jgi:drug/metabolite transporter (DMT)-like permease
MVYQNTNNWKEICNVSIILLNILLMDEAKNIKAYVAWGAVCLIWGTTYLAIRVGVTGMPPFLFAGLRWLMAGSLILVFLILKGEKLPNKSDFISISITGICLIGITNGLVTFSEQWIPSGLAALIITTVPFVVVLIESFIMKRRKVNLQTILGLLCGFSGILIILGNNVQFLFESEYLFGIILLFIGVISWSFGSIYSKYHPVSVNTFVSASIQMLVAGTFQTVLGLILGEADSFVITMPAFYSFLYLLFFASLFGYGSYIYALTHLPVSFVTTYAYINPVIALFAGWIFLEENLGLALIFSATVIIIGVYLVKRGSLTKQQ